MNGSSCPLAHFEGPFTDEERAKIHRAVSLAEAAFDGKASPSWGGKPWIVTCIEGTQVERTLVAHRLGTKKPLVARSVDDLVAQMATP